VVKNCPQEALEKGKSWSNVKRMVEIGQDGGFVDALCPLRDNRN